MYKRQYLDCSSIERREKNIKGDKAEVFYTDVIKKYRFPEFSGEKFLSECVLWNEIARLSLIHIYTNASINISHLEKN